MSDENLSSSLPIYTGVFWGFGCSRIKYWGCLRMEYWESLLIGLCFPFSLLSPPPFLFRSSTFFFHLLFSAYHSVEAGSFATLHSCALKSIFELYDKLVDRPSLWSPRLQSTSSSSSSSCFFFSDPLEKSSVLVTCREGLALVAVGVHITTFPLFLLQCRVRIECGWLIFFFFFSGRALGCSIYPKNKDVVGTSRI
ncbi:hypothetical protein M431DRAFT_281434 [Trichoderma harzianum CBS 226.95]|uniref:Uncharacterized protein n=1 Tax=Trichoderma harzianum CBS 226.95 TaxID=983964 RepID=A0A2T4ANY3_TRIHA|nr:hypothetical protein M431DRAFT_281434 [Trichoderma harzianum CBS 226.95]PTB58618.1 hypothetical protein M431DRAFT_281434 [Trichoderma harzianum CBS 226.95]